MLAPCSHRHRKPVSMSVLYLENYVQDLLMIRQISLRERLPPDGASQEIDAAWAALQRCSVTASQRGQAVSISETVGSLCVATGILLVYRDAVEYSIDVSNLLAGLKGCVLQEAALLINAVGEPHVYSCCGVICSLLLTQKDIASLPQALHTSIAAAAGEVVVQQALAAVPHTPRGPGAAFATAPILIYATSIFAAFSCSVFTARAPAELQSLLDPLAVAAASVCLPQASSPHQELSDEQRAVLQRAMVPVLHQILQRTTQFTPAAEPPTEPTQPPSAQRFPSFRQLPILQHFHKLFATQEQVDTIIRPTKTAAASASAAVKIAQILSMCYHSHSRSSSPHLSSLICTILAQLVQSNTSALQLAQHIVRPYYLCTSSQQLDGHPITLPQMMHPASNGLALHAADAQGGAESAASQHSQLQERAELHQELTEHLVPALQHPGHWQPAACFMLTLLMPCLQHRQQGSPGSCDAGFWDSLMNELLPVLQVLALSQPMAKAALEACMSLLGACPDAAPSKARFCRWFTGVICLHLPDGDPDCFASALAGVAKYCQPTVATGCCRLCCSMTRVGASSDVQLQVIRALVSVVVHGSSECLHPVLELLSMQLQSLGSGSDKERALSHVRHGLMHCHDFRKKPDCVRWFHAQLSSLHFSSL